MGGELFAKYPQLTATADEVLGYSIEELCNRDPNDELRLTQFTQPALFVVNALTYLDIMSNHEDPPQFLAGHSLGEYNALLVAEVFDFETGLKLVQRRGQLMGQAEGGAMAAVIGMNIDKVAGLLEQHGLDGVDIANLNTPEQIVISGLKADLDRAKSIFQQAGVKLYAPLKVSAAFHSRYMAEAEAAFATFLNQFSFQPPSIPVISNIQARIYSQTKVPQTLASQITHPVKWVESIRFLMGKGVTDFVEVGPGKVLTKLVRIIREQTEPLVVEETSNPAEAPTAQAAEPDRKGSGVVKPETLGDQGFRSDYGVQYAYVAGSMMAGISSLAMVKAMARERMLSFFGAGGLSLDRVAQSIDELKKQLSPDAPFGINILKNNDQAEMELVELLLNRGIQNVEASGFIQLTPALVYFRLKGAKEIAGQVVAPNRIMAKAMRPEVAELWLHPAPQPMVKTLLETGKLTQEEARLSAQIPMCSDLCAAADSAWQTDGGNPYTLLPALKMMARETGQKLSYASPVRVGTCGGIGTPQAMVAAWVMGADFIQTGSINQSCVEADTSNEVKEMLQTVDVQDMAYAPAIDGFELGVKVQVLKRGVFFPMRAAKLYDLYRRYESLGDIDEKTSRQIQDRFLRCSFGQARKDALEFFTPFDADLEARIQRNPKAEMALVFKWYLQRGLLLARSGSSEQRVDFQIFCGPAQGAFNRWVRGTPLESWRHRKVAEVAIKLMSASAEALGRGLQTYLPD